METLYYIAHLLIVIILQLKVPYNFFVRKDTSAKKVKAPVHKKEMFTCTFFIIV